MEVAAIVAVDASIGELRVGVAEQEQRVVRGGGVVGRRNVPRRRQLLDARERLLEQLGAAGAAVGRAAGERPEGHAEPDRCVDGGIGRVVRERRRLRRLRAAEDRRVERDGRLRRARRHEVAERDPQGSRPARALDRLREIHDLRGEDSGRRAHRSGERDVLYAQVAGLRRPVGAAFGDGALLEAERVTRASANGEEMDAFRQIGVDPPERLRERLQVHVLEEVLASGPLTGAAKSGIERADERLLEEVDHARRATQRPETNCGADLDADDVRLRHHFGVGLRPAVGLVLEAEAERLRLRGVDEDDCVVDRDETGVGADLRRGCRAEARVRHVLRAAVAGNARIGEAAQRSRTACVESARQREQETERRLRPHHGLQRSIRRARSRLWVHRGFDEGSSAIVCHGHDRRVMGHPRDETPRFQGQSSCGRSLAHAFFVTCPRPSRG